ncbi:unnamed protein product [Moneuplotes crassus]|uniref:Uncharacterized protein n=1 Tax=Euplotes crassus TaxID=5936 RepID=A0AAD1YCA2_EUPCR|nr:unnamed protein product [Moneuplotes crassus]
MNPDNPYSSSTLQIPPPSSTYHITIDRPLFPNSPIPQSPFPNLSPNKNPHPSNCRPQTSKNHVFRRKLSGIRQERSEGTKRSKKTKKVVTKRKESHRNYHIYERLYPFNSKTGLLKK